MPKLIDLCLIKLVLCMQNEICTPKEVLEAFVLTKEDIHFKYEKQLTDMKVDINKWKWEVLNDISGSPKALAQLMLDFMEQLSVPIIE